uniref:Uncharacterized protein n=1 Tax=Crocodylus porosus TaxID=8502 RepID=A0A7M4EZW6_CROPO
MMVGARCLLPEHPCLHPPRPGWALGGQGRRGPTAPGGVTKAAPARGPRHRGAGEHGSHGLRRHQHRAAKHAKLAGIYSGAVEDSLFLKHRERHCHGEDRKLLQKKISYEMVIQDVPLHSPLSRYQKSAIAHAWRKKL